MTILKNWREGGLLWGVFHVLKVGKCLDLKCEVVSEEIHVYTAITM